jgi:hypothetical protein
MAFLGLFARLGLPVAPLRQAKAYYSLIRTIPKFPGWHPCATTHQLLSSHHNGYFTTV